MTRVPAARLIACLLALTIPAPAQAPPDRTVFFDDFSGSALVVA